MVTSERPLTVPVRLAVVSASSRDVRPAATAVSESDSGIVRTVSIMWITPPLNVTSY